MTGTVLILADRFDATADKVVDELNVRGTPVFRCDVAEFPESMSVSAELTGQQWSGSFRTGRRTLDLTELSGMYYRRPTRFAFHPDMTAEERRWAGVQARIGFGGLLAAVGPWLNHPHRIGLAEHKPVQLRTAEQCGLRVPRTLLTNDPTAARAFVTEMGRAVCKPLGGTGITDPDGFRQVFTRVVTPQQCEDPNIARTMHLFQQWVPKAYEVRLTVVDDQFFAARIDSGSVRSSVDWRADDPALSYTPVDMPDRVRSGVRRLLDTLGLRFGALDLVVSPDGDWWFLEVNPNGQWGWIEDETGLPIAAAMADALEGHRK